MIDFLLFLRRHKARAYHGDDDSHDNMYSEKFRASKISKNSKTKNQTQCCPHITHRLDAIRVAYQKMTIRLSLGFVLVFQNL